MTRIDQCPSRSLTNGWRSDKWKDSTWIRSVVGLLDQRVGAFTIVVGIGSVVGLPDRRVGVFTIVAGIGSVVGLPDRRVGAFTIIVGIGSVGSFANGFVLLALLCARQSRYKKINVFIIHQTILDLLACVFLILTIVFVRMEIASIAAKWIVCLLFETNGRGPRFHLWTKMCDLQLTQGRQDLNHESITKCYANFNFDE